MNQQTQQEIVTDDGLVYRLKRPLHKQTLFWTTLVSGIVIFLLSLLSLLLVVTAIGLVEENDHLKELTGYHHSSLDSYSAYPFEKKVEFSDGLRVTVHAAEADSRRVMSDESTGVAVVVSLTLENTSQKPILVSPYDFSLYDRKENVYVLDGSTFDNAQIGMNLAPGKSTSFDLIFDGEDGDEAAYTVVYENAKWVKEPSNKKNKD
ncbi:hypothetical protein STRDD11_00288 [Streptococcus sp. DD11]|uniref:DUF4352 domain-containing protein n=1 Tax=Streptococcus sp. DD11 TaxID=1777879 RepID=UPI0007936AB3|nr:DUF4352 domain-containing protein [Streptococcus sp. DD11]KXT85650.1 hypothetical protein STRDD11_00288 [Streptococcus sp. DD11]